jgi:hypothetical protein
MSVPDTDQVLTGGDGEVGVVGVVSGTELFDLSSLPHERIPIKAHAAATLRIVPLLEGVGKGQESLGRRRRTLWKSRSVASKGRNGKALRKVSLTIAIGAGTPISRFDIVVSSRLPLRPKT